MGGLRNVEDAQGMEPVQFRPFAAAGEKNEGKWTKMTKMHCPLLVKR
jgi:hypothetical protein